MKAVYFQLANKDEAFYLNDTCIVMNDFASGDSNSVFDVAQQTADALGIELTCIENVPEPDSDDWDMREVYISLNA